MSSILHYLNTINRFTLHLGEIPEPRKIHIDPRVKSSVTTKHYQLLGKITDKIENLDEKIKILATEITQNEVEVNKIYQHILELRETRKKRIRDFNIALGTSGGTQYSAGATAGGVGIAGLFGYIAAPYVMIPLSIILGAFAAFSASTQQTVTAKKKLLEDYQSKDIDKIINEDSLDIEEEQDSVNEKFRKEATEIAEKLQADKKENCKIIVLNFIELLEKNTATVAKYKKILEVVKKVLTELKKEQDSFTNIIDKTSPGEVTSAVFSDAKDLSNQFIQTMQGKRRADTEDGGDLKKRKTEKDD